MRCLDVCLYRYYVLQMCVFIYAHGSSGDILVLAFFVSDCGD